MSRALAAALAAVAALSACDSPEATRTRGGGPGADTGNRGAVVFMYEGAKPYADTPKLIVGKPPSIESANHADGLSRK